MASGTSIINNKARRSLELASSKLNTQLKEK